MRKTAFLLLALAAASLAHASGRAPYPSDYKKPPCAIIGCVTWDQGQFLQAGGTFGGVSIHPDWLDQHWAWLNEAMAPMCAKIAACYASPGNSRIFCNDLMHDEMVGLCSRFEEGSEDLRQCRMAANTFAKGNDLRSVDSYKTVQDCLKGQPAPKPKDIEPVVWSVPEHIGADYDGKFTWYALDPETNIPVEATVRIEDQIVYSTNVPGGQPATYWSFPWKVKFNRVPNAQGHSDVVAPKVTIAAPFFRPVVRTMPVDVPALRVELDPKSSELKPGLNTITVKAFDAATGKPVEMRVMAGTVALGNTNEPLEFAMTKGSRPEIWVTSLYDAYSDVVVLPAGK